MAHILSLPQEIQIRIFTHLDHVSLLRSASTCRLYYQTCKESLELQYIIELSMKGMDDAGSRFSRADILSRLGGLHGAWDALDWKRLTTFSIRDDDDDSSLMYDLAAGVFASSDHHGLQLLRLPSPTLDNRPLKRQRHSLGVPIKDFTIDPTQDVIAILENDHYPISITHGRDVRVHLKSISLNDYHPLAAHGVLTFAITPDAGSGMHIPSCSLQFAEDVLGIFLRKGRLGPSGKSRVLLWNWREGTLLYDSNHSVTKLPHHFQDFGLLSRNSFVVTVTHESGVVVLYKFSSSVPDPTLPLSPPTVAVTLSLPSILAHCYLLNFTIHSGPILGAPPQDSLFLTTPDSRIQAISLLYAEGNNSSPLAVSYWLFVHTRLLLDYIRRHESGPEGSSDSEIVVEWESWGEMNARFILDEPVPEWLKYVHGQRVVFQSSRSIYVDVLDFNANANRQPSDRPSASTFTSDFRSSDSHRRTCSDPTLISAGSLFQRDVITRLPYRMTTRSVGQRYFALMIDQEHLIGLKMGNGNGMELDAYSF
ncbi:hypothetical protein GALMADRAFT_159658 [Galerina marginata CBS 339.88]|uniref:F-box domain-containing protein n=1 Tax=Galerina marginata (strain CBS 339.88) TaxID=685588 RepID=A0A067SIM9_GALM3|nr:hypothetical protein GALMADRAFT_159658 [Galerina marginata CBS 339.88]